MERRDGAKPTEDGSCPALDGPRTSYVGQRHRSPERQVREDMSDGRATVFVVDDDISVRESLRLLIESAGWEPETFASGSEFLARPRAMAPSCLVLDVVLPNLNGCDLQKLVADRADMPIIFISGHVDVPITVRAMKAGAVDFFTKPFVNDVLLGTIRNAIDRSQAALRDAEDMRVLRARYASLSHRE